MVTPEGCWKASAHHQMMYCVVCSAHTTKIGSSPVCLWYDIEVIMAWGLIMAWAPVVTTVDRHCDPSGRTGPGPDMDLSLHLVPFAVSNVKPFPMDKQSQISRHVKTAKNQKGLLEWSFMVKSLNFIIFFFSDLSAVHSHLQQLCQTSHLVQFWLKDNFSLNHNKKAACHCYSNFSACKLVSYLKDGNQSLSLTVFTEGYIAWCVLVYVMVL